MTTYNIMGRGPQYYEHVCCTFSLVQTNTFQAVIATNETKSYAIFLYGEIEWLDGKTVVGVIDGRGYPLFAVELTYSIIESFIRAYPSGILVVDLNKYYWDSVTTQDDTSHKDTSKLSMYSGKLRQSLEMLQQSIDLYSK